MPVYYYSTRNIFFSKIYMLYTQKKYLSKFNLAPVEWHIYYKWTTQSWRAHQFSLARTRILRSGPGIDFFFTLLTNLSALGPRVWVAGPISLLTFDYLHILVLLRFCLPPPERFSFVFVTLRKRCGEKSKGRRADFKSCQCFGKNKCPGIIEA